MIGRGNGNLAQDFYRIAQQNPERLALWVDGVEYSYGEVAALAGRIAAWIPPDGSLIGVLASRSVAAYAAILGVCWSGAAYVPISPKTPPDRLARILDIAGVTTLIADSAGLARLLDQTSLDGHLSILAPTQPGPFPLSPVRVQGFDALPPHSVGPPQDKPSSDLAYVMFTSGTTGTPKGVMVSIGNVLAVLAALQARFPLTSTDRVSQSYELTFDLSVADVFWTLGTGASLHVVPESELMAPNHFIQSRSLTVWSSVPSVVTILSSMRRLKPGALPTLRYSWFCGEALPVASARAWREAANTSVIDNLYGPTEATVACLGYRYAEPAEVTAGREVLAIGTPFPGTEAMVVGPDLERLGFGATGQLVLSGDQLARGYLDDPVMTESRFVRIEDKRWYLTGDLAYQNDNGSFHHLGRLDNQVKILGHRVELEEVDAHLRAACGVEAAATVAWPLEDSSVRGLVAFVAGATLPAEAIRQILKERLPGYMVPGRIILLDALPLTANRKVDRKALLGKLAEEAAAKRTR